MSRPDPLDQHVIAEFRARGGGVGAMSNLSLLLLHHVGAKSGTERVTPLAYWPVSAASVAVLASNRGAATHPHWFHNLVANPITTAETGTDAWAVRARIAHGEQRRTLISAITAQSRSAAAAVKHAPREIPVVILELLEKREPPRSPRREVARPRRGPTLEPWRSTPSQRVTVVHPAAHLSGSSAMASAVGARCEQSNRHGASGRTAGLHRTRLDLGSTHPRGGGRTRRQARSRARVSSGAMRTARRAGLVI